MAGRSRGTHALADRPASPGALLALRRIGLDISQHKGRQLTLDDARRAALILTMEEGHRELVRDLVPEEAEKVQRLTHFEARPEEDIWDPHGGPLVLHEACRDRIALAVEAVVGHLAQMDRS